MALISNGYGKVINMDINDYLDTTDEEWQEIIASGYGEEIDNPFHDPFSKTTRIIIDDDEIDEIVLSELQNIEYIVDLDLEIQEPEE